jgi:uncharacterized sodium:solute symporter family permease YidK
VPRQEFQERFEIESKRSSSFLNNIRNPQIVASYELNAVIILQLLGHVFVPVYIASGVTTLPEYLEKRLKSRRLPVVFSIMSLVLYVLTKISVNLYSGTKN